MLLRFLSTVTRYSVSILLLGAGFYKVYSAEHVSDSLLTAFSFFDLQPSLGVIELTSRVIIAMEVSIGTLLLISKQRAFSLLCGMGLLTVYTLFLSLLVVAHGGSSPCHCEPITGTWNTWSSLVRNVLLLALMGVSLKVEVDGGRHQPPSNESMSPCWDDTLSNPIAKTRR
jgi:hypothetical protein